MVLTENTFNTGTVRLKYAEGGLESPSPLIMLHGGAWRWQEFLSLLPGLSMHWHTCAVDLRGHGRSGHVPGQYRLADFVEDTLALLGHLRGEAVLLGHSLGGVIAIMTAGRCPEKVRALVIEDVPMDIENYRRVVETSRDMYQVWLDLKNGSCSEEELSSTLVRQYGDFPGISAEWLRFLAGCLWHLDPTFFDPLLHDFEGFTRGYTCQEIFPKISCPMLFLRGEPERGAVMTEAEIRWALEHFGNVSYAPIAGVGHLLHLEEPGREPVLQKITDFLAHI